MFLEVLLTLMIIESLTEIPSQYHHYRLNVRCIADKLDNIQSCSGPQQIERKVSGNKAVFMVGASSHIEGGAVNTELQNNRFETEAREIAGINPVAA